MRNRLPVDIDNLELPQDKYAKMDETNNNSYGYVNILYLLSLIITLGSVLTVIYLGK